MCARLSLTPRMGQISDFKVSLHQAEAAVHNYVVASDHKKLPKAFLHEIAFSSDVGLSEGTLLGRQMRVGPKGQLDISWTTLDYMLKKNLVKGVPGKMSLNGFCEWLGYRFGRPDAENSHCYYIDKAHTKPRHVVEGPRRRKFVSALSEPHP